MDGIIEAINVNFDKEEMKKLFQLTVRNSSLSYIECGANSWILDSNFNYEEIWSSILSNHRRVHNKLCNLATGFNYNETNLHTVPPHIDTDEKNCFNLLLPLFGVAKIDIFETQLSELEFRHGKTHWMMLKKGIEGKKINSFLVDSPVLLNTKWLHSVQPMASPRCVWCTRWIDIETSIGFSVFKTRVEEVLNA